ncbi:putative pyridine nucleotide-disulfide oxidoreductase RclA [Methylobacterium crusticola]|uniref:Pyridine nucleotide-disulfide oxidoreductase RclA n=1 Tax=Methylobacterium crusticola TaxID=1697972 RepID=A0ABQ4R8X1_9HYPH|nr:FAD-dependent oxidoreductase [Methylobacterium crusticola]GJD53559.1 putative pyridine nucleotide-disulfide oxidoreductase RclA [Methylobacterium crusticola]
MSATDPSLDANPRHVQAGDAEARTASQLEHFDVLILGSGQGGKLLAWHLGRTGRRVAVVERRWVGGSCPNIACLPSKNEIWSAKVAHLVRHAARFGTITGPVTTDMEAVRQRKRTMVEGEVAFHLKAYREAGVDLIMGTGRFVAPKTLEVRLNDGGTRVLTGDQVFLNLGTHATIPVIPGLAEAAPLTHIETLELDAVPSHLIVLGGGYVGLEMAQALGRFGSRVTILQAGPQLLSNEDADVATEMQAILAAEGITVVTHAETLSVTGRSGQAVSLVVRTGAGEQTIAGSHILVAAGRSPNTQGIGLEEAGVTLTDRGYIRVNDRLETSAPGIWALGEAAGSPQFTHVSVDDFRIIRDNLAGGQRSTHDRLVPANMFTEPPLARVGLNEREAQRQGVTVRVTRLPMSAVLRTQTTGETQGFMKALVGEDDRILGFTMIGSEAGEVLAVAQMAMLAGLPYQRLRDAVLAHPTMAEGLGPLFAGVPPRSS